MVVASIQEATSSAPIEARAKPVFSFNTRFFTCLVWLGEKGTLSTSGGGGGRVEVDATVMDTGAAPAVQAHGSSQTVLFSGMTYHS